MGWLACCERAGKGKPRTTGRDFTTQGRNCLGKRRANCKLSLPRERQIIISGVRLGLQFFYLMNFFTQSDTPPAATHPAGAGFPAAILTLIAGWGGSLTTPPNQGIPDTKSKCEEMMRMAQGTLQDDKNAISSRLPSVRGGFSGKIVTDGNPNTLLCPNPSEMTNAHIMQQCGTQCNVM